METGNRVFEPTLCWDCKNAVRPDKCPWCADFTPVPGWNAVEVPPSNDLTKPYSSYHVISCPLFEQDSCAGGKKKCGGGEEPVCKQGGAKSLDIIDCEVLQAYAQSGMRVYRAMKMTHYDRRTIANRLTNIRKKTNIDPREFEGLNALLKIIREGNETNG